MRIRITRDHPRYARLRAGLVVEAEPVAALASAKNPPELMRVKDFADYENGAIVRSWELVLADEEIEAFVRDD